MIGSTSVNNFIYSFSLHPYAIHRDEDMTQSRNSRQFFSHTKLFRIKSINKSEKFMFEILPNQGINIDKEIDPVS